MGNWFFLYDLLRRSAVIGRTVRNSRSGLDDVISASEPNRLPDGFILLFVIYIPVNKVVYIKYRISSCRVPSHAWTERRPADSEDELLNNKENSPCWPDFNVSSARILRIDCKVSEMRLCVQCSWIVPCWSLGLRSNSVVRPEAINPMDAAGAGQSEGYCGSDNSSPGRTPFYVWLQPVWVIGLKLVICYAVVLYCVLYIHSTILYL